jgi:hypothetical protein
VIGRKSLISGEIPRDCLFVPVFGAGRIEPFIEALFGCRSGLIRIRESSTTRIAPASNALAAVEIATLSLC